MPDNILAAWVQVPECQAPYNVAPIIANAVTWGVIALAIIATVALWIVLEHRK